MISRLVYFFVLLCIVPGALTYGALSAQAQGRPGPIYQDSLNAAHSQPFSLRTFIVPGSERVFIDGAAIDTSQYRIQYRHGLLWMDDLPDTTAASVVVEYRRLPFELQDVYQLGTITDTVRTPSGGAPVPVSSTPSVDPIAITGLTHSGSITRGILAGNNRDVTVESGLRLQLSGEIAENVHVQAVLTDENTPILPEGTTQRLEEFDRVFIGIEAPYGTAQLGDFDLQFASSEFARLSRKLQGASFTADLHAAQVPRLSQGLVTVAGATSRGVFRSQEIEPIDGVQGPYRLEGSQGERFILVVPGSEIVYVDGRQLTRGESNHYTIDYATAEIHFTPAVIVTDDIRIRVEFQYSTNQFTRSLIASEAETHFWPSETGTSRARFGAAFLREADSREFGEEFGFGREDSLALVNAGDGLATSGGAVQVDFDPEAPYIHYLRETRVQPDGDVDSIFVAVETRPPDSVAVFRVQFSRVGQGQGSYERVGRSVNGILYEYRGPNLGDYLPVRILPSPKHQRLLDLHGGVQPIQGVEFFGEWARSMMDANRLSPLDDGDDQGNAYVMGVRMTEVPIGPVDVSGEIRRRFTAATFESFDRIRPVEFGRRWNLVEESITATGGVVGGGNELIDEGSIRVDLTESTNLRAEIGRIDLGSTFEGTRRAGFLGLGRVGIPIFDYQIEHIESRDSLTNEDGIWLRQLGIARYPTFSGHLTPHLQIEHERRRQRVIGTDSLAQRSFNFLEIRPGVAWKSGDFEVDAYVKLRNEDDWIAGTVEDASRSWTAQTTFNYGTSATFDAEGSIGYRNRRFTDRFRVEQLREDAESIILQWNTKYQPLQQAVQINWLYEGISERTPTLQEIYVRTGPEIGQYIWVDTNDNGIVEIDEFVPESLPNEGTYVKTYIPSDDLIPVVNVQTRLQLELDPARLWRNSESTWRNRVANVTSRTIVEIREKTRDPAIASIYLLNVSKFRQPGQTLNGRLRLAQDLFFFRGRPDYGLDVSFNQVRSLSELSAGSEAHFVNIWRIDGRRQFAEAWSARLVSTYEQNRLESAAFASRTYDIHALRVEPEASFRISPRLQIVGSPSYARKNDEFGGLRARVVKLPTELRYTVPRKLQMTVRGEVAYIELDGAAVGLAEFELTDGRGPGTSYLWSLRGQYTLNEYLRATFSYDGRAPSEAPVIHTMQIQLSALF